MLGEPQHRPRSFEDKPHLVQNQGTFCVMNRVKNHKFFHLISQHLFCIYTRGKRAKRDAFEQSELDRMHAPATSEVTLLGETPGTRDDRLTSSTFWRDPKTSIG